MLRGAGFGGASVVPRRYSVPPAAPSATVQPAVYRTWGTPVDSVARGTLPLLPNHGLQTTDVALFRNGVEVPLYVEALRGRHNNGTGGDGGARAFYYECNTTGWTDGDVLEWRLGTSRLTTDLSAAGRGSMAMVRAHFANPRVVLCTNADYLCASYIALHPLVTDAEKIAAEQGWAITFRDNHINRYGQTWWPSPKGMGVYGSAANWYDMAWVAFCWWCETGNPNRWWEANRWADYYFDYNSPPANDSTTAAGIHFNPEQIAGSVSSTPVEWKSMTVRETAVTYLCTGYGQFWRNACFRAMQSMGTQSWYDDGTNIITAGGGRFNMGIKILPAMYASLIDATWIPSTGTWAGGNTRRQPNFVSDLPRILTAFDDAKLTAAGAGAYRANYRGYRDTTLAMNELANNPGSYGDFEQFQGSMPTKALIDYYLLIHADPRIPGWVRQNAETICHNCFAHPVTGYIGAEYQATRTPQRRKGALEAPWNDGPYYPYLALNNVRLAQSYTGTTQITLAADESRTPIVGRYIGLWWQISNVNYNYGRQIQAYDPVTKIVTFDAPLPSSPASAPWVQYAFFTTNDAERHVAPALGNVLDHMRILQFCAALYPTDVVNGRTFAEWADEFGTQITQMQARSLWATDGSMLGRWMETAGCYFRAKGVPAGPSAIREPIIYSGA